MGPPRNEIKRRRGRHSAADATPSRDERRGTVASGTANSLPVVAADNGRGRIHCALSLPEKGAQKDLPASRLWSVPAGTTKVAPGPFRQQRRRVPSYERD